MRLGIIPAIIAAVISVPAHAAEPISLQDSFRIGTGGNIMCSAQLMPTGKALADMFDRGYSIVCRDAAVPIGQLYALRERGGDPAARLAGLRGETARCEHGQTQDVQGLGAVDVLSCRLIDADVAYTVYAKRQGGTLYVAEGLAGYDSALCLGLRNLVADRIVPGDVSVATTGIGDPAAFARVQAGSLTPERALAEAYRRNNSGNYTEAAEFFGTLSTGATKSRAEALANEALQRSNLGAYGEADALFAQADPLVSGDPIRERQLRNFRAMHLLNQGRLADAEAELARPVTNVQESANSALQQLVIDADTSKQLSGETAASRRLGAQDGLSPKDKIQILDAQSLQLKGTILRLQGRPADAASALRQAESQLQVVREGRVAATHWMRAQIFADLADIAEAGGNAGEAEGLHRSATTLVETYYPGSLALLGAKGRLASFYARTGRTGEALAYFREIVEANSEVGSASPALRRIFSTYFDLLLQKSETTSAAEMFRASQLLIRPGLAQTQVILARELSGGSDEASRLFRQAINLNREAERLRVEMGRLRLQGADANQAALAELGASLAQIGKDQVANQSALSAFPRYRAISNAALTLPELQAQLRPGEAYYKMVTLEGAAYAVFADRDHARAVRIGMTPTELDYQVDNIRATISTVENGEIVTLPYDVEGAHRLYTALFDLLGTELAGVTHLIFEPDGAMLRLPPNLLVMDRASVDAYRARAARANDDGFDFRGVAWLGRDRNISTAVSPRAFVELRQSAPSHAKAQYIGFGEHKPTNAFFQPAGSTRGAASDTCQWSYAAWGRPISAGELMTARQILGGSGGAEVVTGQAFTDTGIRARSDLDQYRIVHFATHGLLSPPRSDCPARPALMTSFGGEGSDGLLSFGEIFDLRLDADVIILSACDTAGRASLAANREAGITSGGDFALDGLVRAFVGAGGRLVVASHWPVPDDFSATQRLISGLFNAPPGTGTAAALREAQRLLMDDVMTSHPFYWAGFAVIGDGALPLIRPAAVQTAGVQ